MTSLLSCSRLVQAGFDFTPSRIPLTGGGASNDSAPFKRSILWGWRSCGWGISWIVLIIIGEPNRFNPAAYLTRLTAFVVIIVTIVDKNRPSRSY
ncbi:MAG TPA: hypothetical protein VFR12_03985 [Pyrinomonadaceae bacterium]|nr:hypothetical protein [Pyrinomonadaceae bacterium]